MNTKKLLFFVLLFVGLVFLDNSKVYAYSEPFTEELPSQQTEQELQRMSESSSNLNTPQLRARPGDINGSDQGQKVPLGDIGLVELAFLVISSAVYFGVSRRFKRTKQIMKLTLSLLLFAVGFGSINAQIKAVPDNYFVEPNVIKALDVVSNDEPGDCADTRELLSLSVVTPPHPDITCQAMGQVIRVRASATARGQYSLKYRITCNSGTPTFSEAVVYINVANHPDFMDDAACTIDRPAFKWDIERKAYTNEFVQSYAFPLVGDVDGDGKIEIITTNLLKANTTTFTPRHANVLYIFDSDLKLKQQIKVPLMDVYTIQAMAIADIDPANNDGPEILIGTGGNGKAVDVPLQSLVTLKDPYKLYCYHYNKGTGQWYVKWSSSATYIPTDASGNPTTQAHPLANGHFVAPSNPVNNIGASISIADVDGDGLVEILIGESVYSGGDKDGLNGGRLLGRLPGSGISDVFRRGFGRTRLDFWCPSYINSFADIDGDGMMEIVAGNATYKMSLNHDNPALSTISLYRAINQFDGYTTVADIDGDEKSDVVVVARELNNILNADRATDLYVWHGNTSSLIGPVLKDGNWPGGGVRVIGSRAFVGDIDGDGRADVAFTSGKYFDAVKYNKVTNKFENLFTTTTSDNSGATTMTMFDFDNDGKVELVYRDETDLRIVGKHPVTGAWTDLLKIPCFSGTHTEYPVVADVDLDGHADIIVSGTLTDVGSSLVNGSQRLQKFGSVTPKTWSPARSVWHQHGYNPTMINENLTVPKYPFNPALPVTRKDGTVHYPYNSFLQQVSVLNMEGDPLFLAPDLAFQSKSQQMSLDATGQHLTITAYVENVGNKEFEGNLLLSLYAYFETTSTYQFIGSKVYPTQTINVFGQESYQFTINNFAAMGLDPTKFYLTLNMNDAGGVAPTPYYMNQEECFSWNNFTSRLSYITGHVVLCDGETATLNIEPSGKYDCYWYEDDGVGGKTPYPTMTTNLGDSKSVTKGNTGADEFYLINVHQISKGNPVSAIPDTVFIYQSKDTLIWTGAENSDWHNVNNWICPTDTKSETFRYIPRGCTNVLIPATKPNGTPMAIYPDLSANSTRYNSYEEAACNNISFEHGAEVANIDLLTYDKAYIQVDLLSNRWYTFAPPLRSFYTGDIYDTKPNPFEDGLMAYTRMFSQPDPQHSSYVQGNWGRAFNTPTQTFSVGEGLGLWIDDFVDNETIKSVQSFSFPKSDADYNLYDLAPPHSVTDGPLPVADRSRSHRFIFEDNFNATTKNVELQVEATAAGQRILIANPYMAHLDFDKFYSYGNNKNLIESHYAIMEDGYSYATYYENNPGASTGVPKLNKYIAPMQAIIVQAKVAIDPGVNPLITNGTMTVNQPGASLRGVQATDDIANFFKVSISDVKKRNKTTLVLNTKANNDFKFDNTVDVLKTITQQATVVEKVHPVIYFITEDSKYADIKALPKVKELTLPLGIQYAGVGPMALGFENIAFFSGYYVYLHDKVEGREVLLTDESPIYCFNNTDTRVFVDDRFSIRVTKELSGIEDEIVDSNIIIKTDGDAVSILSTDHSDLGQVIVYNLQGKLVINEEVRASSYSTILTKGVYIIRVKNTTKKLIL